MLVFIFYRDKYSLKIIIKYNFKFLKKGLVKFMLKRYLFRLKIQNEINCIANQRRKLGENLNTTVKKRRFNNCKLKEVNLVALLNKITQENMSNEEIKIRFNSIMRE